MANQFNTLQDAPGIIAKMAAQMFANKTNFCKAIEKEESAIFDGTNGYNAGDTIQISKPARFNPGTTADITSAIQDVVEEKTSLSLDVLSNVPIALTSAEIVTEASLKSWAKRVLEPAVSSIAQDVEKRFLEKAIDGTQNVVGTPGSSSFDTLLMNEARALINKNACPDLSNRFAMLNADATTKAVDARKGLFQASDEIAQQYKEGYIGRADGFDYVESNLMGTHTNGNDVTGVNVDGAAQTGSTINLQGFTATTGTITKGSVFTIAGVNRVNQITKEDEGELQQFTVLADGTADGSGDIAVSIYPAIVTTGSTQTVTAAPADTAAVTFVGAASTSYKQNLAFHKSAYRMVSVPLNLPQGIDMGAQETVDGMTIRVIRDYDVLSDKLIMRLDFLGGLAVVRPEWGVRIYS